MPLPVTLEDLRTRVRDGETFRYRLFYGHTKAPLSKLTTAVFSQFYPCRFEIDGQLYYWAEQWMMAEKARLFADAEAEREILAATTPMACKMLGRQVRDFDEAVWRKARFDIVVAGNRQKFGQDEALRDYLLASEGEILVEAAPSDRIWGIGLDRNAPEASDPVQWRGQNLLGFALMRARQDLAARQ